MGLLSFFKGVGEKVFGHTDEAAPDAPALRASAMLKHVQDLGLAFNSLTVNVHGDTVTIGGETATQADSEKIALAVGNVEGVHAVDNQLVVATPAPEARYYTVVAGDSLSKISKEMYGEGNKYEQIFEANKPMLTSVDKIYPGQVLRIPAE